MNGQGADETPSLGGWRFLRRLAVTAFSHIWLAEDLALARPVVFKILAPKPGPGGSLPPFPLVEWGRRFFLEARVLARIEHPHIVPVVHLATLDDGRPAIVMQCLWGSLAGEIGLDEFDPRQQETLSAELRPRALPPARARQITVELLSALVCVHQRGLVHRDVHPGNLLLSNGPGGRVKLGDFGLVRTAHDPELPDGRWLATGPYFAPEHRANPSRATAKADIYSAAALGLRMLSGAAPDPGGAGMASAGPKALADLLIGAMAPDPEARPDALTLARQLAALPL